MSTEHTGRYPCPECGSPVTIDWLDATALSDPRPVRIAGRIECIRDRTHHTGILAEAITWPAELTGDEIALLLRHAALTRAVAEADRALTALT